MTDLVSVSSNTTPKTPERSDLAAVWRDLVGDIEWAANRLADAAEEAADKADELASDSDAPDDLRDAAEDVSCAAAEAEREVRWRLDALRLAVAEASDDAGENVGGQS